MDMISQAEPLFAAFRLPRLTLRAFRMSRRRKQTTIDLLHASPHLQRDLGIDADWITHRRP